MNVRTFISSRYGFSPENRHRGTSVTILLTIAFCMFAMTMVLSLMRLLASSRMDEIRRYESYDAVFDVKGREEAERKAMDLSSEKNVSAFIYAECPVLVSGKMMEARFLEEGSPPTSYFSVYSGTEGVRFPTILSYLAASGRAKVVFLRSGKQAKVVPKAEYVEITGYYATTDISYDGNTIIFPLSMADAYSVSWHVGCFTKGNPDTLAHTFGGKSYKEANASLYGALRLEQTVMDIMFTLLLLIVVSSVRRSTKRLLECKKKEIGMLRTMGLSKRDIKRILVSQSMLVSVLGVLCGFVLSLLCITFSPQILSFASRYSSLFLGMDALTFPTMQMVIVALLVLLGTYGFTESGARRFLNLSIMEMMQDA